MSSLFDIRSLARALGGDVTGPNSVSCPGPGHSPVDRSLSVHFVPSGGFIVYSHAGDQFQVCRDYVCERLGLPVWSGNKRRAPRRHPPIADIEERNAKHMAFARSIWDTTKPAKSSVVERYLVETRKLELPDSEAIRFHPRLKVARTDPAQYAPAMVCVMTDIKSDEFTGVHRTFLTADAKKISNAILGRAGHSAIKIDRVEGHGLGIAEGIETTIAARFLYRPVWSVMSANGIRQFPVLAIEHLEIFADNDPSNVGENAARECLERWDNAGAEVTIVMPPRKGSDIADFIAARKVH